MNAPEKCPKCGAAFVQVEADDWGDRVLNYARFKCETTVYEDRQLRLQGHFCIIKERDQLTSQVAELADCLSLLYTILKEWQADFPDCVGDNEPAAMATAASLIAKHKPIL